MHFVIRTTRRHDVALRVPIDTEDPAGMWETLDRFSCLPIPDADDRRSVTRKQQIRLLGMKLEVVGQGPVTERRDLLLRFQIEDIDWPIVRRVFVGDRHKSVVFTEIRGPEKRLVEAQDRLFAIKV